MDETITCATCGAQWTVRREKVVGDAVPSPDEIGTRRQVWYQTHVVSGTPCNCEQRAEVERKERCRQAAAREAAEDAAARELYQEVLARGVPLSPETPCRRPDYDLGGWQDEAYPLGRMAERFWLLDGRLYYVRDNRATPARGASYADGELRVLDPWLLL